MTEETLKMGHNSGLAADLLKQAIQRVERLEEEIKGLQDDRKDVYDWAKSSGLDVKILRQVIRRRKMDPAERDEQDDLIELYEGTVADFH
jgi:uncharacterized protein (UPF0335 family)